MGKCRKCPCTISDCFGCEYCIKYRPRNGYRKKKTDNQENMKDARELEKKLISRNNSWTFRSTEEIISIYRQITKELLRRKISLRSVGLTGKAGRKASYFKNRVTRENNDLKENSKDEY